MRASLAVSGLRGLWQSRFARNVMVIASGTAGAQAVAIVFAPLITRIYGPEAFGLLGAYLAVIAVVVPLGALAYPTAIVLPRSDSVALGLVRLSAVLSFVMALLAGAVLWAAGYWILRSLGAGELIGFLFLVPFAMLFSAWIQIVQQWLIRKGDFGVVARSAIIHAILLYSAKVAAGWFHPVAALLIFIVTIGYALHAALLLVGAKRRYVGSKGEDREAVSAPLKSLAWRHRDFPLYRAPQNLINAASQSLPILMLAALFGPAAAGFYALGRMVMGAPSALLGKAVNDVFYPRITQAAYNQEDLFRLIVRATGALAALAAVPFALIVLFGPSLFSFAFGQDWEVAGEYARWLAIFFLFNFVNKPCVAAVPVLGIQRGLLIYEVFSTLGKALGLFAGFYWMKSDLWAVALFSSIGAAAYVVMMLWILSRSIKRDLNAKASQ